MKVLIIQHVVFENPGYFLDFFSDYGAEFQFLNQFETETKRISEFDVLLVMGGPMNIYEEDLYPWLKEEKSIIKDAITGNKVVIGVCLGAQLIADALGERTYRNKAREIGWFPVQKSNNDLLNFLPEFATVFHWHGETFDLPNGCISFYRSDITENQAFLYQNRVLALQFHLEMLKEGGSLLCENCSDELDGTSYVMNPVQIEEGFEKYAYSNHKMLANLLKWLLEQNGLL
jgi:GMP synthase-like glutamine amidotransferase